METMSPSEDSKARQAKAGCQKEPLDLSGAAQMKTFFQLWDERCLMIFDGHCLYVPKINPNLWGRQKNCSLFVFVSSHYFKIGSGDGG